MAGNSITRLFGAKPKAVSGDSLHTKLSADTPFHYAEAYKTIRTNLLFSLAATDNRSVVFSSAMPSECKSTTSSNSAIAMSQNDCRVLLIDADMRKPTLHTIFRRSNRKGLSRVLAGFDDLADAIHEEDVNLHLLTAGPIPPNPSELLGSENMSTLLTFLKDKYDYIFIDTPPINVVSDAMIVAAKCAGIVLVARQGQTSHDDLTKAIRSIEFSGVNILGMIMTAQRDKGGTYGKSYSHYAYSENGD